MIDLESRTSRAAGVLLHPTSLPSGHLDVDASRWLEWLHQAGFSVWQMLPLGVPNEGLSPYQCQSAFALNPALLSIIPDKAESIASLDNPMAAFEAYSRQHRDWLEDYALFVVLKRLHAQSHWNQWPDAHKFRDLDALAELRQQYSTELATIRWQQFYLHYYWATLLADAHDLGVRLFGDLPIFVAYDSADVWANPGLFLLDEALNPTTVAGVPPDYFSETGQRWGNPHYNWEAMQADGFRWWLARLGYLAELFDLVRIDHFRGLVSVWQIDPQCETAIDGHWQPTPGFELMHATQQMPWQLDLVAEDLGIITEAVNELRLAFDLPGMAVLQFGFSGSKDNPHHPNNITHDRIVYTGTHDNDTLLGWYHSLDETECQTLHQELGSIDQTSSINRLTQMALDSPANLALFPMQDLLKLDSNARMNTPGTTDNNWCWRFDWDQLAPDLAGHWHQQLAGSARL